MPILIFSVHHLSKCKPELDITSVVIFTAHRFSLPFTFVLLAKDFDFPLSWGYLMNNVQQFRGFLMIYSAIIKTKL